jgi:hypothetical protein
VNGTQWRVELTRSAQRDLRRLDPLVPERVPVVSAFPVCIDTRSHARARSAACACKPLALNARYGAMLGLVLLSIP